MSRFDWTVADAVAKAEHLKALGDTELYVRDADGFPWQSAYKVEAGSGYRLNGPTGVYIFANHPSGLTFKLSVDFEGRDANGRGVSLFERDRLRDVMLKLPHGARLSFAELLETQVLPALDKNTADIRDALNKQSDSEDCVRGLIAFAKSP